MISTWAEHAAPQIMSNPHNALETFYNIASNQTHIPIKEEFRPGVFYIYKCYTKIVHDF
jgi:hypothetical protein